MVRGSRSWTLATKGALALHLPYLVADAEDQEVDVTVGLGGAESWGDVIIGAEEPTGVHFEALNFKWSIKRWVGTLWGLSPELKDFLQQHMFPLQRPVARSQPCYFATLVWGLVLFYVSCNVASNVTTPEVSEEAADA